MDSFVFFWKKDQSNGYLSNWSDHSIRDEGLVFKTLEHFLMYSKACLFSDFDTAKNILNAKHLGRQVKNFDAKIWEANKRGI